jgi:hypothetical protein
MKSGTLITLVVLVALAVGFAVTSRIDAAYWRDATIVSTRGAADLVQQYKSTWIKRGEWPGLGEATASRWVFHGRVPGDSPSDVYYLSSRRDVRPSLIIRLLSHGQLDFEVVIASEYPIEGSLPSSAPSPASPTPL